MTDDNSTNNLVDMDDLDAFSKAMFGEAESADEPNEAPEEDEEEVEDHEADDLATDEDEDAGDEPDEDSEEEEDDEPKPQKKPQSPAQKRINELTRARREAERREAELLRRLEALEAETRSNERQEPVQQHLPKGAPTPDAVDANGEPLYPLGEFDPTFIRDLTKFTIAEETKAAKAAMEAEAAARREAEQRANLSSQWNEKLEKAEEEIPEIREHIADLVETIQSMGVDPNYGDYLAMTVMQCENGPAILEYLSENIGEAQKIVASGPAAATLAIGRLEAQLSVNSRPNEQEKRNIRIPTAKTPPPTQTKGRQGKSYVRGDTDNLDDFEKVFYGKK